ncbi:MAG: hypothetical protein FWC91_13150 [Defluviitaleaceae bacterium]|nr:hypothetical protein [Defluviitaleaceae bacterium]
MNDEIQNNDEIQSNNETQGNNEEQRNSVITLHRRVQLCLATSGGIPSIAPITHIAFGDGGVDGNGDPIPPVETQISLNNQVGMYPINGVTYPLTPPTTARYTATIPAMDLASVSISEAALVDEDGHLHAIKTFYVKRKDEDITFTFTFDDEF